MTDENLCSKWRCSSSMNFIFIFTTLLISSWCSSLYATRHGEDAVDDTVQHTHHGRGVRHQVHIKFRKVSELKHAFNPLLSKGDYSQLHSLSQEENSIELLIVDKDTLQKHRYLVTLTRNKFLLTKNFMKTYFDEDDKAVTKKSGAEEEDMTLCYYTGTVHGRDSSVVSLNICNGMDGFIEVDDAVYHVETDIKDSRFHYHLVREEDLVLPDGERLAPHTCGNDDIADRVPQSETRTKRRVRGPGALHTGTRYVEMYVVIDRELYRRAGSVDAAIHRVINIVNYASGLYRPMNLYLALVGVEVWSNRNKITLRNNISSNDVLTDFLNYRQRFINPVILNDNAQLFTGVRFHSSTIGKGITGGMCTHRWSGAVSTDYHEADWRVVATTMAHEMGHNLGLSHDDAVGAYPGQDCSCPIGSKGRCVMFSVSLTTQPKTFSQCSIDAVKTSFEYFDTDYCLQNIPQELEKSGATPICGNFFIEEGEECDCGLPEDCTNKCCDPTTCRLKGNSTCSAGGCCDTNTCTLRPKAYQCRPLKNDHCDLGEHCNGVSEWCPDDTYIANGQPCDNYGPGQCYEGECASRNGQCAYLWGDGAKSSSEVCYTQWNNRSNYYGNCGYTLSTNSQDKLVTTYKSCEHEEDLKCGLLHCDAEDFNLQIGIKALVRYKNTFQKKGQEHVCQIASVDTGRGEFDPGMVPNGASCGNSKMCVHQKCVAKDTLPDWCKCHNRGVCNQHMQCHCKAGWAPPFCLSRGDGGSESSGPLIHYDHTRVLKIGFGVTFGILGLLGIGFLVLWFKKRETIKRIFKTIGAAGRFTTAKPMKPSGPPKKSTTPPSKPPPTGRVQNRAANPQNRNNISEPIFQSTTNNNTSQLGHAQALKPSRTAPLPPVPTNNKKVKPKRPPSYENSPAFVSSPPVNSPPPVNDAPAGIVLPRVAMKPKVPPATTSAAPTNVTSPVSAGESIAARTARLANAMNPGDQPAPPKVALKPPSARFGNGGKPGVKPKPAVKPVRT